MGGNGIDEDASFQRNSIFLNQFTLVPEIAGESAKIFRYLTNEQL
jgi:hypothetical protein